MRDGKLREAWRLVCLETVSQTDLTVPPPIAPQTAGSENTPTPSKHPSLCSTDTSIQPRELHIMARMRGISYFNVVLLIPLTKAVRVLSHSLLLRGSVIF